MPVDEKYPVLNRDNLTIPIQMQLSQKQKTFYQFFPGFLKSKLNFKYFGQKMTLIDFLFSKLQTAKTYPDKCLKSPVSEDACFFFFFDSLFKIDIQIYVIVKSLVTMF